MAGMSKVDTEFLQGMIEHHQEALKMATAYLKHPGGQRMAVVSDLARGVITAQTAEIKKMTMWLTAAGKSASGGKSMED